MNQHVLGHFVSSFGIKKGTPLGESHLSEEEGGEVKKYILLCKLTCSLTRVYGNVHGWLLVVSLSSVLFLHWRLANV